MKRHCRPIFNYILVKMKPTEKVTSGGIVIPDKIAEQRQYDTADAYIVAMGDAACIGMGTGKMQYKVGDCVKVLKYSGVDDASIEEGSLHRVIKDDDVIGVYEGEGLND